MLGALKRARQSVNQPVKLLKKYYPEYGPVIHPPQATTRKHVGNGTPTQGTYLTGPIRPSVFGDSFY